MSKTYKGYELIKAIADGEIKEGTEIEVHSLKVLDNIIATIKYTNKRLEWATGEFDSSCLVDNDYYFKVLEDEIDIQSIEKIRYYRTSEDDLYNDNFEDFRGVINELVEAVKQLDRKSK